MGFGKLLKIAAVPTEIISKISVFQVFSTKEGHPHFCWIATALMFPLRKTNTTEVLLTPVSFV